MSETKAPPIKSDDDKPKLSARDEAELALIRAKLATERELKKEVILQRAKLEQETIEIENRNKSLFRVGRWVEFVVAVLFAFAAILVWWFAKGEAIFAAESNLTNKNGELAAVEAKIADSNAIICPNVFFQKI
ncbi:MAG: hypothetical protein KUG79_16985 [Pseudomonadales bacterium]|nr:hypothetical protein [Pseudomonadales bacterium]